MFANFEQPLQKRLYGKKKSKPFLLPAGND